MTVRVDLHAEDFEPTERLRDHVVAKISALDRYLDVLESARVDLRYAKAARSARDRHVAQVTVQGKGVVLRAEERSSDMTASVDAVVEKIHRQMDRYKGRRWKARGDGRSAAEVAPEAIGLPESVPDAPAIARRKKVALAPMDMPEAMEQMSLLSHEDFFIFLHAATNQVHVLYRRRDGSLGLIETEIG
ncbi:MAG: ribosome-associated translation inhibitor RaiA [Anaerolineales bacterium]